MLSVINDKIQHISPENDYSIKEINLLLNIIKEASRVLSKGIIEIESVQILENIEYKSPKAANQPINYASGRQTLEGLDRNGFVRRFGYAFSRIDNNSAWIEAKIGISSGVVRSTLNLTKDFFQNELELIFDKAESINDPNDLVTEQNVFYFHSADSKLRYVFHARTDDSNIKDGYPKNFFNLKIIKQ